MAKKKPTVTNAMRMITAAKLNYELIEYEVDRVGDNFGMEIAGRTGIDPHQSFKTLVLRGERNGIAVACIPCCCEVDLKKTAKLCKDKRVELIHVRELLELTGYARGSVSPIGMKKSYPTFIDASALRFDKIVISGGTCGAAVMMTPSDIQKLTHCRFEDIVSESR